MRQTLINKRKSIALAMFFLFNVCYSKSIVEIPNLYREISNISSKKLSVYQIVIVDLNNCQTCNLWYPELMKKCDTNVFIYFKGARVKDKEKLAKRYNLLESRVLVGTLTEKSTLALSKVVFFEVYENDDRVSIYSVRDMAEISKICTNIFSKELPIQCEDVFSRFDKVTGCGDYIYGVTEPLMQLARIHPDSNKIELYESSKYDSFYWAIIFPQLQRNDTTLLNKNESINEVQKANQILSMFYPVNIFAAENRCFIATQPLTFSKVNGKIQARGINLIVEMDEKWNIVNYWRMRSNNKTSPIVGFSFNSGKFYFGQIDIDGLYFSEAEFLDSNRDKRDENGLGYKIEMLKKYDFMEYSSKNIGFGKNTVYFKNVPIINFIDSHQSKSIDVSEYIGIKLNKKSFYINLDAAYRNDTLTLLCSVNRDLISIKLASGKLISRNKYSLSNKYNPLYNLIKNKGLLFYQTKEDYFKCQFTLE